MKTLHIITTLLLLITIPAMAFAETTVAQAQARATEQADDLFAHIQGHELSDAQADAVMGTGLVGAFSGFIYGVVGTGWVETGFALMQGNSNSLTPMTLLKAGLAGAVFGLFFPSP